MKAHAHNELKINGFAFIIMLLILLIYFFIIGWSGVIAVSKGQDGCASGFIVVIIYLIVKSIFIGVAGINGKK